MNADRSEGEQPGGDRTRKVAGSIKEAVGKITGDISTEREGAAEKAGAEPTNLKPKPKP